MLRKSDNSSLVMNHEASSKRNWKVRKQSRGSRGTRQNDSSRRKQKGGERRKRKGQSLEQSNTTEDIEEQLRRQRLKQQQETHCSSETQQEMPQTLGNYRYDKERGAYFPATDTIERSDTKSSAEHSYLPARHGSFFYTDFQKDLSSIPSVRLAYPTSVCSSVPQRIRLTSNWAGRSLLESARLTPSAAMSRNGQWSFLLQRDFSDIPCKVTSPSWSRTFDVCSNVDTNELPYLTSLVDEGVILRTSTKKVLLPYPYYATRLLSLQSDQGQPTHIGLLKRSGSGCSFDQTNISRIQEDASTKIPAVANDFCNYKDIVYLAMGYNRKHGGRPWIIQGAEGGRYRVSSFPVPKFPKSDSLCVQVNQDGDAFFGHRNGQLTIYDEYDQVCCSTKPSQAFGSITSINVLDDCNLVLARGSFGSCRLYDVRKMGMDSYYQEDPAVVHEFTFPDHQSTERLTTRCNGVATNSTKNVAISPFVNGEEVPCLGVWSLHSGQYLGSKKLAYSLEDEMTPATSTWGVAWIELCQTITPAWRWKDECKERPVRAVESVPGSFGLWYKCGQSIAGPTIPLEAGSIHHVYFDGRID